MIPWYCHIDTGVVTTATTGGNVLRASGKRLTTLDREIFFHDGSVIVYPDVSALFVAKVLNSETGLPEGEFRVWDTSWDAPASQNAGWVFSAPLWGEHVDSIAADGSGNRVLGSEIHFEINGSRRKSQTITLTIEPPIYNEEDPPEDPDAPFPNPDQILVKGAQVLSPEQKAQVRTNIGLDLMGFRNLVAVPANETSPGGPGDYSRSGNSLYIYVGDGTSHAWLCFTGANAFTNA